MEFRDLRRQYEALKPEIDEALLGCASSGGFIQGRHVAELEAQLADYAGVEHCVTCANGTDALSLALRVWQVGEGDAVFVPDFTFFASAEVVAAQGATPVFVPVRPDTYNMDPEALEQRIERVKAEGRLRPRVVLAVDLFGLPADFNRIIPIAEANNLLLLEDAAQGFGGAIGGRKACSFGHIAATSFFPAKPLGCYGDGGAIFTNRADWAAAARSLAQHGRGASKYEHTAVGLNSRLDAIQAAVLKVKLKAFANYELEKVQHIAKQYTEALASAVVTPTVAEGFSSSWAQYTVRFANCSKRDKVKQYLAAKGIPSMIYYPSPMHLQPVFADLLRADKELESGWASVKACLSLPMHPYLTDQEVTLVANTVIEALNE
ncbi:MAG: DegT/DnrJ/EryC1/StrS family aminotransferase [Bacteroidales bacterium]|nr:DegT/DnrJ/EryC1/StrS family aminotransferase [Bacteroidales bacterium]